jgi:hypothetical protein
MMQGRNNAGCAGLPDGCKVTGSEGPNQRNVCCKSATIVFSPLLSNCIIVAILKDLKLSSLLKEVFTIDCKIHCCCQINFIFIHPNKQLKSITSETPGK